MDKLAYQSGVDFALDEFLKLAGPGSWQSQMDALHGADAAMNPYYAKAHPNVRPRAQAPVAQPAAQPLSAPNYSTIADRAIQQESVEKSPWNKKAPAAPRRQVAHAAPAAPAPAPQQQAAPAPAPAPQQQAAPRRAPQQQQSATAPQRAAPQRRQPAPAPAQQAAPAQPWYMSMPGMQYAARPATSSLAHAGPGNAAQPLAAHPNMQQQAAAGQTWPGARMPARGRAQPAPRAPQPQGASIWNDFAKPMAQSLGQTGSDMWKGRGLAPTFGRAYNALNPSPPAQAAQQSPPPSPSYLRDMPYADF